MSEHRRRIDTVLHPGHLADLPEWPLDELRRPARGRPDVSAAPE